MLRFLCFAACWCLSFSCYGLVVLQYHHVSDTTPKITSISPQRFREHLDYIEQAQFRVADIRELRGWLNRGETLPDKTVVITFDDGYRSVYAEAFPELKKRKWPFAVFINTRPHDEKNPQYMSWDDLRSMAKYGAVIGNHTDSHPHLIRRQHYQTHEQWRQRRTDEIMFAEARIEKEIGHSDKLFAYPFGEHDQDLQGVLKDKGFIAFGQQSGPVATSSNVQVLPRFPFGGNYGDMQDFATKLSSLPFPQARIKVTNDDGSVLRDPALPQAVKRPILRLASPLLSYIARVNCFASDQGRIHSDVRGGVLIAQATRDLGPGRSRYNCTASAGKGRFYWHSELFIRRRENGDWVNE